MTLLDVVVGVILVTGFVLSTAALLVAGGWSWRVPPVVQRFLESAAEGQGVAPVGREWLAFAVFGAVVVGIVYAEVASFLQQVGAHNPDGAVMPVAAMVVEVAWLAYVLLKRRPTS